MSSSSPKSDHGSDEGLADVSDVGGNATCETKRIVLKWLTWFGERESFAEAVNNRVKVTEVSINRKGEEPERTEARVVCELDVHEDMVNISGYMHGSCAAFLIDICSTLPISALSWAQGDQGDPGVSQAINTVFHAPAHLGAKLRLVNTSLTIGARTMSARTEIWDDTTHRLVASGVQVKMLPSAPKL